MFDVFYEGAKPNLFAFERPARDLDDAAAQCRTGYYWYIYGGNDYSTFDFGFVPAPWESTHTHVWPTQWNQFGGAYLAHIDSVKERTWQFHNIAVKTIPTQENWVTFYELEDFDYSWVPHPMDPPYIYVFGNNWYPPEIMPTVEYRVPGATEQKFMHEPIARLWSNTAQWDNLQEHRYDFDYSWRPDPGQPPMVYIFGNQHWPAEMMPTLRYVDPRATETSPVKYMDWPRARLLPNKNLWTVPEEVNVDSVDYSWVPDPGAPPYVYHFGTDYQQSVGLTYTVPGATELKFAGPIPVEGNSQVVDVLDIFFIDRGNPTAQARYDTLAEKYSVTKVRYANSMMDTITRCVTRSKTNKFWIISSEYDYSNFDFAWHAEPWQSYMTHVFPSQHNKWSDTFLVNKYEFERHSRWAKGLEEFPNLNFVSTQSVVKPDNIHDMYYVDHGNIESRPHYNLLKKNFPDIILTRFANTYLDTFKRIMFNAETEYVWILNSVCNYDFFDFTWQPEPWQKEMIHCFTNGLSHDKSEKRGDTFYIHVESFQAQMIELELLDWFNVINYIDGNVERWPTPAVYYHNDNLIEAIKNYTFTTPFALFTRHSEYVNITNNTCLWTERDRTVRDMSLDRSTSIIPRDIKRYLKTQVYDYPYLDTTRGRNIRFTPDIDIVYISNGEPDEEKWFRHTEYMSNRDVKWIRGVDGRVAAYQAAANASTTDWFFAVFAKLEVLGGDFDWHWQPDYWQGPKHYIFNARNPVNGLEYGHMGMIAYNKRLVLANNAPGIDFTLSQPHESVPILSGVAHFNQDAWTTWRTAFREVLKLRLFMATQPTVETEERLRTWLTVAQGNYSNYCLDGARDAVEYYTEVAGDPAKLQLSFEWKWLRDRYDAKY